MEISDEATAGFRPSGFAKGGVVDRRVVPIGLGPLGVVDPFKTFASESRG